MQALEMVRLATFGERFPRELSGGQQQRVALARALVYQPSLLLMDESLSALDRKLRENMHMEIRRIHRETGTTIVFVTHDQEEALALSDRVCLMNGGRIEQIGMPQASYETPRSAFVADFIGVSNKLRGRAGDDGVPNIFASKKATAASSADVSSNASIAARKRVCSSNCKAVRC